MLLFLGFRCRESVDFSLKCAWLLDAYSSDAAVPSKKKPHGIKLKNLILSDELRPRNPKKTITPLTIATTLTLPPPPSAIATTTKKTHQRSQSDASALTTSKNSGLAKLLCLGDLSSGRAFDNGCMCFNTCQGVVNDLRGEKTECSCSVSANL